MIDWFRPQKLSLISQNLSFSFDWKWLILFWIFLPYSAICDEFNCKKINNLFFGYFSHSSQTRYPLSFQILWLFLRKKWLVSQSNKRKIGNSGHFRLNSKIDFWKKKMQVFDTFHCNIKQCRTTQYYNILV